MPHLQCSVHEICGGCTYQHLEQEAYQKLKMDDFRQAFSCLNPDDNLFQDAIFIPPKTRRRTVVSFYHDGIDYVWGYKQAKSHKIIPATDCIVVTDDILCAMHALGGWIKKLIKPNIQIKAHITQIDNGLDISLRGIAKPNAKNLKALLDDITQKIPKLIRLSIDHEIIFQSEKPFIQLKDYKICVPPEAFLQPSQTGQETLVKLVSENLGKTSKKSKILDLFSGLGTFTLPLSDYASITAYDNAGAAMDALSETVKNYGLEDKIQVKKRDLFRDPLSFLELKEFDLAVIDPPRAGAKSQAEQLAKSQIKKIIYVFCNPDTAARDIRILSQGGYNIKMLRAIDQFTFSTHIEGIAVLQR